MIAHVRPVQLQVWFEQLAANGDAPPGLAPLVLDVREPWELQIASIKAPQGFESLGGLETLAMARHAPCSALTLLTDIIRPRRRKSFSGFNDLFAVGPASPRSSAIP